MDIQLQIEDILRAMNFTISSHHMKGHQGKAKTNETEDRTKTKDRSTWQAKLNIQADQLATQACNKLYNTTVKNNFNMLPAAKA
eukprot:15334905-Ditylum_brightwellii.AAC.1